MHKETITYTDYSGKTRTEDFYFNLTQAELAEWTLSTSGGLDKFIERVQKANDTPELAKLFKELILKSYGVKDVVDGDKYFIKNEEEVKKFTYCPAYSALYMKLATDSEAAAKFVNEITPVELQDHLPVSK